MKGLAREDLFTVVHERFMTDTARYADLVLPATSSLEHSDIYRSYGTYCLQRAKALIPPVGESKSNWEVFSLLAEAMGFPEPFFRQSADDLIDLLVSIPTPLREGIEGTLFRRGRPWRSLSRKTGKCNSKPLPGKSRSEIQRNPSRCRSISLPTGGISLSG